MESSMSSQVDVDRLNIRWEYKLILRDIYFQWSPVSEFVSSPKQLTCIKKMG